MVTEMSAQLARMGQLAIDVENLKTRNAVLEAELAQVNRVRLHIRAVLVRLSVTIPSHCPGLTLRLQDAIIR